MSVQEKDGFSKLLELAEDPRAADLLFVKTPIPTLIICSLYLYVVKILGPKFMETRQAYKLKYTLIVYNAFQVAFNVYIFYELSMGGWLTGQYSFMCQPVDYSDSGLRILKASHMYFLSKFPDLLDTVFFILRKKNNQVTPLHVIHHAIMPLSVWSGMNYVAGGHGSFFGFLNSFIHIIMYGYYLLSAFGPKIQKYLWWKKYLTMLQMIQFLLIMIHSMQLFFIECNFPIIFAWIILLHAVLFYGLFYHFYRKSYTADATKNSDKKKTRRD